MAVQELRKSSAIEQVAYSDSARTLSVWFNGGRLYVYADVPRAIYDELCAAPSAGRFVNQRIKGRFRCHSLPPRNRFLPRDL